MAPAARVAYSAAMPVSTGPLNTPDGTAVRVVHIVAELAPFARSGGLGEAVNSLARFQSASGQWTAIVMPLYDTARENAPAIEPVGPAFNISVGPRSETVRLWRSSPHRATRSPRPTSSSSRAKSTSLVRRSTVRQDRTIRTTRDGTRASPSRRSKRFRRSPAMHRYFCTRTIGTPRSPLSTCAPASPATNAISA